LKDEEEVEEVAPLSVWHEARRRRSDGGITRVESSN